MATETVWAYKRLHELNGELGFVACDEAVAKQLIAAGLAQDPQIGATLLHERDFTPLAEPRKGTRDESQTYDDKAMAAKRRSK